MIKSYTSKEQSEILIKLGIPIETADMWYQHIGYSITDGKEKPTYFPMVIRDNISDDDIPCWSLAALLNYIKDKCGYFELVYLNHTIDGRANILENVYRLSTDVYDVYKKEAVDACYEMIIKLNEQKLL